MTAPLLNEYKASFAARRFVTTLSGGPGLPPPDTPFVHALLVVLMSVTTLALPAIAAGILLAVSGEQACVFGSVPSIVYACVIAALDWTLHSLVLVYNESESMAPLREAEHDMFQQSVGSDEDPALMGPPISAAFGFVFNQSRAMPRIDTIKPLRVFKGLVAGVMSAATLAYLSPSQLTARFGSIPAIWAVYVFSWLAWCMAHWPLVGPKPSEFNTYQTEDRFRIDDFSRAAHIAIILLLWGLQESIPALSLIGPALGVAFAALPLAWSIGVLPSARILFIKIIELAHTVLLGGPALVNTTRMAVVLLFFSLPVVIGTCICASMGSYYAALVVAAVGGCMNASRVWVDAIMYSTTIAAMPMLAAHTWQSRTRSKRHIESIGEWIHLVICLAITAGLVAAVIQAAPSTAATVHSMYPAFCSLTIAVTVAIKATREVQQVYVPSVFPLILNPIRVNNGTGGLQSLLGLAHVAAYHLAPWATLGWIATSFVGMPGFASANAWTLSSSAGTLNWIWTSIMLSRCLLIAWHRTEETATDVCLVMVVNAAASSGSTVSCSSTAGGSVAAWWCGLDAGTRLFFVGLAKNAVVRIACKTHYWILGVKHFLLNRKQRHPQWHWLIAPILLISPLSIVVGGVLDLPTMAFLGLPLLILGFPRPTRMWTGFYREYSAGQDAKLYAAMAPSLLASVSQAIATGKIPPIRPGNVMLARIESRLLMFRGVETWFEGSSVVIAGAELEPTSCHALEGAEVDGILDYSLIFDGMRKPTWINDAIFHTLLPVGTAVASSYIESKQNTTGILDSPAVLKVFPMALFKVLVFTLLRTVPQNDLLIHRDAPVQRPLLQSAWKRFPLKWYDHLKLSDPSSHADANTDQTFMLICISCHTLLLGATIQTIDNPTVSPASLFDMYRGDLPYSVHPECRSWWNHKQREPLRRACIQAARYTLKLVYEDAVECGDSTDDASSSGNGGQDQHAQLEAKLQSFVEDWLVTMEVGQANASDPTVPVVAWREALDRGVPNVFALSRRSDNGQLVVRTLCRRSGCVVRLGVISGEAVQSIWANLVFELLYLTNDDDERYSIQAHELLLRNLTVQTAPPPFGYPVWVSPARLGRAGLDTIAKWWSHRRIHGTVHTELDVPQPATFPSRDMPGSGSNGMPSRRRPPSPQPLSVGSSQGEIDVLTHSGGSPSAAGAVSPLSWPTGGAAAGQGATSPGMQGQKPRRVVPLGSNDRLGLPDPSPGAST